MFAIAGILLHGRFCAYSGVLCSVLIFHLEVDVLLLAKAYFLESSARATLGRF